MSSAWGRQRRLTPAGLSACHWRGRLLRSSTRALGVPGRAPEGKQLLGLHARGCRHPQTGLPPSVPQKDVCTCSPRWLHSPAGEERAKAWASDKGQSSTLVAEGPQGFRPPPHPSQLVPKAQASCRHPSRMLLSPSTRHSRARAEPQLHQGHRHLQGGRSLPLPHPQVALLFHGWPLRTCLAGASLGTWRRKPPAPCPAGASSGVAW